MKLTTSTILLLTGSLLLAQVPGPAPARSADLSGEQFDSYLASLKERISINGRDRDPFGLPQDLKKAGKGNTCYLPIHSPFAEIVESLQVTAIDARAGEFLLGARIFRKGAAFPVVKGTYRAHLRIEEVTRTSITFRNIRTGETATRVLKIDPIPAFDWQDPPLPKGVEPADEAPVHLPDLRRS